MRRVAVVASHRREFDGVLRRAGAGRALPLPLEFARALNWSAPGKGDTEWLLLADGIGATAATRACAAIPNPSTLDAIWSIGYCGATQPRWQQGDVLAATNVKHAASGQDFPCALPVSPGRTVSPAMILSVDHIVRFASEKHLIGEGGVDAVEMEAAAVARFAQRHGVPFVALKAVSDTCEEDLPVDFNRARRDDGGIRVHSVLAQALSRPWSSLPGLRHLARASRVASESLGEAMMGISW
ncbi:MAG: hypothetical protein KIT83_06420 [Bryobacterales bacterium]|nr:hypothetical protein [Bryobacterales bacterium]